tara:strand:- start:14691 stop:15047 length:357 start_codon:yes stop_codon:yes gene_type:complete
MGQSCRVAAYMISNSCSYLWNYMSINCFKRSLLTKRVYINGVDEVIYRTTLENFYLCNKIHTLQKLIDMIGFKFNSVLFTLDDDNVEVYINRVDNTITINGQDKRIILGDISLSYILE